MKIRELLGRRAVTLSFEVFPPKADADFEPIREAVGAISALRPDFMSVTYGASGGTSKTPSASPPIYRTVAARPRWPISPVSPPPGRRWRACSAS